MKLVLTILTIFYLNANATIYYVSNAGSDVANGTSISTSWQTISKVNNSTFSAGDQVLLKCGDTWVEKLIPPSSGSEGSPIVFGSYGTGAKPIISGFQLLAGLTNVGNVWSETASAASVDLNVVLVEDIIRAKGRTPNYGYLTYSSSTGTTQIVGTLTGTPDYTGGEAVVRDQRWILDVATITSQSTGTLNLGAGLSYNASNGSTYFVQNIASTLDTIGEWCIDGSKVFKVYSDITPTVKVSILDTLVSVLSKNYITFYNLSFTGADKVAMSHKLSDNITVENCSFNNNTVAIAGTELHNTSLINNTIENSLSNAIRYDPDDETIISGNYIYNTGMFAGMGNNGEGTYTGIYSFGHVAADYGRNNQITNNQVINTGYTALRFLGTDNLVYNNFVDNFCVVKDDGGGIYSFVGMGDVNDDTGSVIRSNIVINGTGTPLTSGTDKYGIGLYLDNGVKGVTLDSNTVYNSTYAGIYLHEVSGDITITDNSVTDSLSTPFLINVTSGTVFNIKRNVWFSKNTSFRSFYSYNANTGVSMDSNYYLRPVAETDLIYFGTNYASVAALTAATGYELNGQSTPHNVSSSIATVYYNTTQANTGVSFEDNRIGAKGIVYFKSVSLKPFTSVILFPTEITTLSRVGNLNFQ